MNIAMPLILNFLQSITGVKLYINTVAVGVWDMDANSQLVVNPGLANNALILYAGFLFDNDTLISINTYSKGFPHIDGGTGMVSGYVGARSWNSIQLYRVSGSDLDSVNYNDAVHNRGYLTYIYTFI